MKKIILFALPLLLAAFTSFSEGPQSGPYYTGGGAGLTNASFVQSQIATALSSNVTLVGNINPTNSTLTNNVATANAVNPTNFAALTLQNLTTNQMSTALLVSNFAPGAKITGTLSGDGSGLTNVSAATATTASNAPNGFPLVSINTPFAINNTNTFFVDAVFGNDTNSGTSPYCPLQSVYAASSHEIAAGGGTIYFSPYQTWTVTNGSYFSNCVLVGKYSTIQCTNMEGVSSVPLGESIICDKGNVTVDGFNLVTLDSGADVIPVFQYKPKAGSSHFYRNITGFGYEDFFGIYSGTGNNATTQTNFLENLNLVWAWDGILCRSAYTQIRNCRFSPTTNALMSSAAWILHGVQIYSGNADIENCQIVFNGGIPQIGIQNAGTGIVNVKNTTITYGTNSYSTLNTNYSNESSGIINVISEINDDRNNGIINFIGTGNGWLWVSNLVDLYWSTATRTNPVALGH